MFGQLTESEESLEALEEGLGVERLVKLVLIVTWETVITNDCLEYALHGVRHYLLN